MIDESSWLAIGFLVIAALYAAVGQAGATGYLAMMGLVGMDPTVMKSTALALNLLVASIATIQFWRAELFSWRTFYPFAVLGFPFSLLGGATHLPAALYQPIVGALLLVAAAQLFRSALGKPGGSHLGSRVPPFLPALIVGAGIGFVSGATGTGGGIFLAPIILAMRWVETRQTAAVTAAYNLLNSAAGLAGAYATLGSLPPALPLWLFAAGIGGTIGATAGARYLPEHALRLVLASLLLISGSKMVLS